jgi:hypothetical protein
MESWDDVVRAAKRRIHRKQLLHRDMIQGGDIHGGHITRPPRDHKLLGLLLLGIHAHRVLRISGNQHRDVHLEQSGHFLNRLRRT